MEKLREKKEIEENPIGLKAEVVKQIVPELDGHVCSLFILYHQYQKHHWMVEGPQFRDLHLYLEGAYNEIHAHLDEIAERMTVLGATPTAGPSALEKGAYIKHEAEGVFPIRTSLENDLKGETEIARHLRKTIRLADDHSDFGTKAMLEQILIAAENRAHRLDHYLAEDSLEHRHAAKGQ